MSQGQEPPHCTTLVSHREGLSQDTWVVLRLMCHKWNKGHNVQVLTQTIATQTVVLRPVAPVSHGSLSEKEILVPTSGY